MNMFIISTDTLRGRKFDQKLPTEWRDKPPLFDVPTNNRRGRRQDQKEEDPLLLKGVSGEISHRAIERGMEKQHILTHIGKNLQLITNLSN